MYTATRGVPAGASTTQGASRATPARARVPTPIGKVPRVLLLAMTLLIAVQMAGVRIDASRHVARDEDVREYAGYGFSRRSACHHVFSERCVNGKRSHVGICT